MNDLAELKARLEYIESIMHQPEIFSRVCGYIRPLANFNPGKISEWKDRIMFKLPEEV